MPRPKAGKRSEVQKKLRGHQPLGAGRIQSAASSSSPRSLASDILRMASASVSEPCAPITA